MGDELRRRLRKLEDVRGSGTPGIVVIWSHGLTPAELDDRVRAVRAAGATPVTLCAPPGAAEPPKLVELQAEPTPEQRTRVRPALYDPARPPPPPERPAT